MIRSTVVMAIGLALVAVLSTAPAQAQRDRVFVASYGNDANPCTFGSPCKTFQGAYNVVAVGGEVTAIDSAGFGQLVIDHSVTITSPYGVEAGIAISLGGTGIVVHAGTGVVVLRGLTLDGAGQGLDGISVSSGQSVTIENCVVHDVTGVGLAVGSSGTAQQTLTVSNSYFNDNGNAGVDLRTLSAGELTASFDRTGFSGNGAGLKVEGQNGTGALIVAVTDSVAANNSGSGFYVQSTTGASVSNLSLTHTQIAGNGTGIEATGAGGMLWFARSTVTGNATAYVRGTSGALISYGDNYMAAANGAGLGGPLGAATTN
jgi:hypothetical protein